ncbi:hypothetical protein V2J09_022574 [Rumex salicifolius]
METNACGRGIDAVLMQEGRPLAYISRNLKGMQLNLSIYKELSAVVFAFQPGSKKHYTWSCDLLRKKGNLVAQDPILMDSVLQWLHCSGAGGHSGRDVTNQRVKGLFYRKGMAKDIQHYIRSYVVCQRCKYDVVAYPRLIQALPIPKSVCFEVSMDFIDGLHCHLERV